VSEEQKAGIARVCLGKAQIEAMPEYSAHYCLTVEVTPELDGKELDNDAIALHMYNINKAVKLALSIDDLEKHNVGESGPFIIAGKAILYIVQLRNEIDAELSDEKKDQQAKFFQHKINGGMATVNTQLRAFYARVVNQNQYIMRIQKKAAETVLDGDPPEGGESSKRRGRKPKVTVQSIQFEDRSEKTEKSEETTPPEVKQLEAEDFQRESL